MTWVTVIDILMETVAMNVSITRNVANEPDRVGKIRARKGDSE